MIHPSKSLDLLPPNPLLATCRFRPQIFLKNYHVHIFSVSPDVVLCPRFYVVALLRCRENFKARAVSCLYGSFIGSFSVKKIEIQCATSGYGQLVFGDIEGCIHLVDRDYNITRTFQAYARFILDIEQGPSCFELR